MDSLRWTSSETVLTTSTWCSQTSTCLVCRPQALPCKLPAAERAAECDAAVQPSACLRCRADMDGFKLLEHIGLELGLPVISALPAFPPLICLHNPGAPSNDAATGSPGAPVYWSESTGVYIYMSHNRCYCICPCASCVMTA